MSGRVLLAAPRSFCAGVDRAIEIVERLLEQHGPPVYVRHHIVHNEHVVRRLERLGAVFVENEDEIPAGEICVLSAHGVAPAVKENCERRGLRVVDAVCPLVSKVHAEARRYADSGHLVALVGHADHVEVIGTRGERPDATVVIESPEDALALDAGGKPIAVVTPDDALARRRRRDGRRARRPLRRPAPARRRRHLLRDPEPPGRRQGDGAARRDARARDRLARRARTRSGWSRWRGCAGAEARLIDGESELPDSLVNGHETIGLTAGASTPEELVRLVAARLTERGYDELEEVTVAREDVHFRLPREVAAGAGAS